MKKVSQWLTFATVLALFALGCENSTDPAEGPQSGQSEIPSLAKGRVTQSVSGSGSFIFGGSNRTFSFTAKLHADGSVDGQWERVNHLGNASQTKSHGQITCFTIFNGNEARLAGFATSGAFSTPPNNAALWHVADNGQGANSPPDQISLQFVGVVPGNAALYCAGAFGNIPPALNNVVGDIKVRP